MRTRHAVALVVDVAVWGLAVWLLTAPPGQPLAPRAWWHASEVCRATARKFGSWALEAERNYWKAVER